MRIWARDKERDEARDEERVEEMDEARGEGCVCARGKLGAYVGWGGVGGGRYVRWKRCRIFSVSNTRCRTRYTID